MVVSRQQRALKMFAEMGSKFGPQEEHSTARARDMLNCRPRTSDITCIIHAGMYVYMCVCLYICVCLCAFGVFLPS